MAKGDDHRIFDEADVLVIAGLALGMTQEAIGNWVCTPMFPAGFSERTVRNRLSENREAYDRLVLRLASAFRRKEEEFEDLTKEKYKEKLAKLRGQRFRVQELALTQGIENPVDSNVLGLAVRVAQNLDDRDFGKAKQVIEGTGGFEHNHNVIWTSQTREDLVQQELDIRESRRLLNALPDGVIEAEIVRAVVVEPVDA